MKTLKVQRESLYYGTAFAIVELNAADLRAIGCVDFKSENVSGDPGEALATIIASDRQATAKAVNSYGPLEAVREVLRKLDAWLSKAGTLVDTGIPPVEPPAATAKAARA